MSNEIQESQQRSFTAIQSFLFDAQQQRVLAGVIRSGHTGINPGVLVRAALMAIRSNPGLLQCSQKSILHSLMVLGAVGLDPTIGSGKAWLIPRKGQCCPQFGYKGYLDLAYRHPLVKAINVALVFDGEPFEIDPTHPTRPIRHKPNLEAGEEDQSWDTLRGGYAICLLRGSTAPIWRWLPKKDIQKRRGMSTNTRADSPWNTHPLSMARKTVLTALIQGGTVPTSEEMVMQGRVEELVESGGDMHDRVALGLPEEIEERPSEPAPAPKIGEIIAEPIPSDRMKWPAVTPDEATMAWKTMQDELGLAPQDAEDQVRLKCGPQFADFSLRLSPLGKIQAAANLLLAQQRKATP